VEDCRQDAQRTKAETGDSYLFISLKQLGFDDAGRLSSGDVVLFVGRDFLLTVHRIPVPLLEPLRAPKQELRPDQVLYRLVDTFVESYIPLVGQLEGASNDWKMRCSAPLGPPCRRKLVRPVARYLNCGVS
jgi:magnesium transporter